MKPFDFINSINNKKKINLTSEYNQFLTTRFFSLFQDTIFIANEANQFKNMENLSHYKFLYNLVSKKNRWTEWPKSKDIENIRMIAEYFEFSLKKANEIIPLLKEEELNTIKQWYEERKITNEK